MTVPSIFVWKVQNAQEKLARTCQIVQTHFLRQERVCIFVADERTATFVDDLLWKQPPESFLPHAIANAPLHTAIVITSGKENWNQAKHCLNLTQELCPTLDGVETIHELQDMADSAKAEATETKLEQYRAQGCTVRDSRGG